MHKNTGLVRLCTMHTASDCDLTNLAKSPSVGRCMTDTKQGLKCLGGGGGVCVRGEGDVTNELP